MAFHKLSRGIKNEPVKETLEETFAKAGLEQGLQIWRIVDLCLEEVPKSQHGYFFSGDSYILLDTIKFRDGSRRWNLHFWLGEKSTQDETTAAPIIATQLDDYLSGGPVQYRELQGYESPQFMKYFKGKAGIIYKEGGHDSVKWKNVKSNIRTIKRVLHIKGKRNVRAREVPFTWNSFNSGDCFIIEIDNNIYKWKGNEANRMEVFKTNEIATQIRDEETGGRARISELSEGGFVPKEVQAHLGDPPETFNEATDDSITIEELMKRNSAGGQENLDKTRHLYHVSSDTGELKVDKIASTPNLKRSALFTGDCYILDAGCEGTIYVWKGKDASPDERKGAMANAKQFIVDHNYPENTNIVVIPEHSDHPVFRQCFDLWDV